MRKKNLYFLIFFLSFLVVQKVNAQVNAEDSLALVDLYEYTDGNNWTDNTGWLTQPVSYWHGVTVEAGSIIQLNLPANNLNGTIPYKIGYLSNLQQLNLEKNKLSGNIPYEFQNLYQVTRIDLSDNQLSGDLYPLEMLPLESLDLSNNQFFGNVPYININIKYLYLNDNNFDYINSMADYLSLEEVTLGDNNFTFKNLETAGISATNYIYSPQNKIKAQKTKFQAAPGYVVSLSLFNITQRSEWSQTNSYQWYKNGTPISETTDSYTINSLTEADTGSYYLEISNLAFPELTLTTEEVKVEFLQPDAGQNDTVCSDFAYLNGNEAYPYTGTWALVSGTGSIATNSVFTTEVTGLSTGENIFRWSFNGQSDEVTIVRLPDLSAENIMAGPDLSLCQSTLPITLSDATPPETYPSTTYSQWSVYEVGYADFSDPSDPNTMIHNLNIGTNTLMWTLGNQCSNGFALVDVTVLETPYPYVGEDRYVGTSSTELATSIYQDETALWSTTGSAVIVNQTASITTVNNLSLGENIFKLTVTNTSGCSGDTTLRVTYQNKTPEKDSLALVDLYNATNGMYWNNNSGWLSEPIANWYGITLDEAHNVIDIYLQSNNLKGGLPNTLGNIDNLEFLDLSYNQIGGEIPQELTQLQQLMGLNLNSNVLNGIVPDGFQYLYLETFNLSNNELTGLNSFGEGYIMDFNISNNYFTFTDLYNVINVYTETKTIFPQKDIPLSINELLVEPEGEFTLDLKQLLQNTDLDQDNFYTWKRNEMTLPTSEHIKGRDSIALIVNALAEGDMGMYHCELTNMMFQGEVIRTSPVDVHFDQVNAGEDQSICGTTAQLNAITPVTGTWTTMGNAVINNPSLYNATVSNLAEGANLFTWNTDFGVDEVTITKGTINAYAGPDGTECSDSYFLNASKPTVGNGVWSSTSGLPVFELPSSASTYVNNLQKGANELTWTVTTKDGCTASDTIIITNKMVVANAGNDTAIYSATTPIPTTSVTLNAQQPADDEVGIWSAVESQATFANPSIYNAVAEGLNEGLNVFQWQVSNVACTATDYVEVISANVITNAGDTVVWNDPTDWSPQIVPNSYDSVSVSNCYVKVIGILAYFETLRIGNGTVVYVGGLAKANGSLSGGHIVIEQDVEKSTKADNPTLRIGTGGSVVIEQDVEKNSGYNRKGLRVGSGGNVVIEQDVEKTTKAISASLTIGSGKGIFVAETNPSATTTNAFMKIGNGGQVIMQNSYIINPINGEGGQYKSDAKFNINPSVAIGAGGSIVIEQDVEKKTKATAALLMQGGGNIVIEQDVEKKGTKAGEGILRITGGSVVIEQDVEKSISKAKLEPNLLVRKGGKVIVEPGTINGSLTAPVIKIAGGNLDIGSAKKVPGSGRISSGSIVIEQDVEKKKTVKSTADFIMYGNSIINFFEIPGTDYDAFLTVKENMAIDINSGVKIITPLITDKAIMDADEESSIVDPGGVIDGEMIVRQKFKAGVPKLISPPVSGTFASIFSNAELAAWAEKTGQWKDFGFIDALKPVTGFKAKFDKNDTIPFKGLPNTGIKDISLNNSSELDANIRGFNLVGNPFAAAVDWEVISLTEIENTLYTYNKVSQNFGIYQKGGYSINGADQYIDPSEGFFVKATLDATAPVLKLDQANTIHNVPGLVKETPYKTSTEGMKLSVSNNSVSDQILLRIDETATTGYDQGLDAFKFLAFNEEIPQIYTLGTGNEKLAMNVVPSPEDYAEAEVIPLNFNSSVSGSYTLNVDEYTFAEKAVVLKDLVSGTTTDLRNTTTYNFDWTGGESEERFQLLFRSTVGINDIEKASGIEIYSHKQTLYVNLLNENSHANVEIFNLSGSKILEKEINKSGISEMKVNALSGTYIVKVIADNKISVKRIFISE